MATTVGALVTMVAATGDDVGRRDTTGRGVAAKATDPAKATDAGERLVMEAGTMGGVGVAEDEDEVDDEEEEDEDDADDDDDTGRTVEGESAVTR